ncbi:serine/threonine-protein kinase [Actinomadura atramentaria]|uniref:serine/threonine-protein kinase n=1 Tax=Actinomadura atramentaria TaxID=1990 RepID=UPI0003A1EAF7|nr:serine/threonine-protein kinase [Actinomadura atramentaria]
MPELQPGDPRRLGSYEVLERLGEGGQGVVYLGVDAAGGKAAIKLLRADLAGDADARNRFVREAQAAKQVARFCTAQVLEADVAGDQPYIASEYVAGPSLYALVSERGPVTGADLDRLAIGTATALVAIHQAGIVHRDFKPHNVIMAPDGPRVIDFGIARALDVGQTAATKAIGTPSYMAPEQVQGQRLTEAVDVWAWAATMVYAATARPPFGEDTVVAVINRVMNEPPSLDGVPADLQGLIAGCLVKDPARRPGAQQIMMALIGGGQPGQTRMDDPAQATALLAEGSQLAGGGADRTRVQQPTRATQPGGPRGVAPADFTGTLPPAANYGGGGGARRADTGGGGGPARWPIVAGVIVVLAILAVIGVALAKSGNKDPEDQPTPAPASQSATTDDETPDEPAPTRSTHRYTPPPTRSEEPPTHSEEPPTTAPPTEPTTNPPDTGGGSGDGGTGDGGSGGTGGTGGSGGGSGGGGSGGSGGGTGAEGGGTTP